MNVTGEEREAGGAGDASCACAFCGLPVPGARQTQQPSYCCYGCRFAASIAAADGEEGQNRWAMTRLGLAVFFAMNVMVFTMLLWSQPEAAADPLAAIWYDLARYACLLFTLPVVFLLGLPLLQGIWDELLRGHPSLSLLLGSGVVASLAYSIYSLLAGSGHVYFEVAVTILVAATLGRWLEAAGKLQTTAALRGLERLLPERVWLVRPEGSYEIPARDLRPGDLFRVLPGQRIAADGQITLHQATVDEQVITGESVPVVKRRGDSVLSGTLVIDGPLIICATSPVGQGTLARMITAVISATAARSRYQRLAERISSVFLPAVAFVAVTTFGVHCFLGDLRGGLLAAMAVVVIACPCSLALATPMALWAAIGRAAQAGVLIRDGDAIARLACARTVCFDKTGTLTTGHARVVDASIPVSADQHRVLRTALLLSTASNHPLASAITHFVTAQIRDLSLDGASEVRSFPGRGVMGRIAELGENAYLGSRRWLVDSGQAWPVDWQSSSLDDAAETLVGWGGWIRGRFALQEDLRPEAAAALAALQQLGLATVMLTGDRQPRAAALAAALGLEAEAELLPEVKQLRVRHHQQRGPVVMVGDGINDAPALAAADVGIALGSGTDVSRDSASICLLGNDLSRLGWLIDFSRQTVRTIRWNLVWAFTYNVAGIGFAAAGWLHPVVAAIAMAASSLLVVANSLWLAHFPLESAIATHAAPLLARDDPATRAELTTLSRSQPLRAEAMG